MGLFTEFIRRLSIEVSPFFKWAQRNWHIVLICLIAGFLDKILAQTESVTALLPYHPPSLTFVSPNCRSEACDIASQREQVCRSRLN